MTPVLIVAAFIAILLASEIFLDRMKQRLWREGRSDREKIASLKSDLRRDKEKIRNELMKDPLISAVAKILAESEKVRGQ